MKVVFGPLSAAHSWAVGVILTGGPVEVTQQVAGHKCVPLLHGRDEVAPTLALGITELVECQLHAK